MNNTNFVSTGKPKISGAVFAAPLGTQLPVTAAEELAGEFEELGYVSEDGVTNTNSPETDNTKAWGGDIVYTMQTSKADEWKLKLIEALRPALLKLVYGDANVSGTLATGLEIKANSKELGEHSFVIDMVLHGGVLKRIVIPKGTITAIGDIVYKDNELIGYDLTISATPDETGDTHKEYIYGAATETVATPTAETPGGAVASGTEIEFTCETPGATMHYTTDGSTPTAESSEYVEGIEITTATTFKVRAYQSGMNPSDVLTVSYTISE